MSSKIVNRPGYCVFVILRHGGGLFESDDTRHDVNRFHRKVIRSHVGTAEEFLPAYGDRAQETGSKERVDQLDAEIRLAVVQILGIQGGATAPLRRGHNQPVVEMNPKGSDGFHGAAHHPGA